jgi:hypothetical protein
VAAQVERLVADLVEPARKVNPTPQRKIVAELAEIQTPLV